jgi:cupredoxin-like protein
MAVAAPARPARTAVRSARFAHLLTAGLVDSFGMTFGWTVFSLLVLDTGGLVAVGVCNAAMLVGVALSAPATAWLSGRLDTRRLLRVASGTEAVLRVASFLLLLSGASLAVLAAVIAVMYAAGLAAYAGMRAEVSAASRPGRHGATMTSFVVAIMAAEAAGVTCAALLPGQPPGTAGGMLAAVVAGYGASQLPTWLVAGGARVGRTPRRAAGVPGGPASPTLLAGALIMLLGSGPALLAVGLAAELHGVRWVAGSALAFTAGTLLAPWAVAVTDRLRLPTTVTWPGWGAGMLLGWVAAPTEVAGLLVAQVLAGLCIAAFEGGMDAHVAATQADGRLMGGLAASEAVRALGSAGAVAVLPALAGAEAVDVFGAVAGTALLAAMLVGLAAHALTAGPEAGLVIDWRRIRMEPHGTTVPEAPDDWARMLKETRRRRRRPLRRWAFVALLLVAVGAVMFQVGQAVAPDPPAAARPAGPGPLSYGAADPSAADPSAADPSAADPAGGPGRYPAVASTAPPAPTTTAPPPRPRLLRLVTRNIQTESDPNRVYLAPGQVTAEQARRGARPRFVVRAGQPLKVRVDNEDLYIHSFTFAKARVNLDIWEGTADSATFDAPSTPGTYQFYCRYRKIGMSGTLVVRAVKP